MHLLTPMASPGRRRLEALLVKKGWNYERLAVELGARSTTVYRWLSDRTRPQPVFRRLLQERFGVRWD